MAKKVFDKVKSLQTWDKDHD